MNEVAEDGDDWRRTALSHLDALYGFAMTLTRDTHDAEDLVQDTYIKATKNFGRLRPDSNLKGWLFIIMRNTWVKKLRRARSGPDFVTLDYIDAEDELAQNLNDPQAHHDKFCAKEELRTALKSLPEACREIIVLRDIEGFSYKEMAVTLDCPIGSIMSRLARSRAKLKCLLFAQNQPILQPEES